MSVFSKDRLVLGHRIRAAMKHGGFDKLDDPVEADETYIGGVKPVKSVGALAIDLIAATNDFCARP